MSGYVSDLRVVFRMLGRTPGFAVAAIGTLGLGLAVTIVALLLVKAYLFTALPYRSAHQLYDVRYAAPGQRPSRHPVHRHVHDAADPSHGGGAG